MLSWLLAGLVGVAGGATITPKGSPECGMEVLSLETHPDGSVTVTSTGGVFEITSSAIRVFRRIDPAVNAPAPREVGRIEFTSPIGPWSWGPTSKRACLIRGTNAALDIRSDSLMFVSNPSATQPLTYVYRSLIPEPTWAKGRGANRMWTDGNGGSLHLTVPGTRLTVSETRPDEMRVTIPPGGRSAVSVFPPKRFDFEKLYGRDARPHVYFTYQARDLGRETRILDWLADRGFGVICLFAGFYSNARDYGGPQGEMPVLNPDRRRWEYRFGQPDLIDRFVTIAHSKGFKVITYFQGRYFSAARQPVETTLAFMRDFQQHHNLDGWFFDNAAVGSWLDTYNFIRRVRADVGDDGIIFHHDSVDVWGGWSGRVMVQIDAYVDYTLKGETGTLAEVHTPNDPYLAYYTGGYGLSQAIPCHKIRSDGRAAVTFPEIMRLLGHNLHGSHRAAHWLLPQWDRHFRPFYEARRKQYRAGSFLPGIQWPVGWFRPARDVAVTTLSPTRARITWTTDKRATSEVRCTTVEAGNLRDSPPKGRRRLERRHDVVLRNLTPGTRYTFAVRSSNGAKGQDEIIWGHVGTFTTPALSAAAGAQRPTRQ